ncbi:glycosyltransferase family 2 protein [candidate division WWE3 bacterium]|jgi:glycosyltransferase involved in cell wall biosynthesis|nr:glycosyltransferase family 2 protein [candidate division WWE3 bacterium]MBT7350411.1 glycosyltransferase family 2 protein [candidate division WWE3 bacterium]
MDKKLVSIVIPCYNEEKNINRTLDDLLKITDKHKYDFEIIAVNDGSKDDTWTVIKQYAEKYDEIVGINQMTNYGLSDAYQAGFDVSKGDYVITLAADLEIPIKNIERVISYLDQEYDFVNTNRVDRWKGAKMSRQITSNTANKLITKISKVEIADRGSGLKGFNRVMIDNLRLYGQMHRFIPDYLSVYGAKMKEFDVKFSDRDYGESAYAGGFSRTIQVVLDMLSLTFLLYFARKPFNMMPGRLFGFTGVMITGFGGVLGSYLAFLKFVLGQSIGNRPLLTAAVLLIIVGVQSMMMGLLGELLLRIYFESSGRRTYTVREVIK